MTLFNHIFQIYATSSQFTNLNYFCVLAKPFMSHHHLTSTTQVPPTTNTSSTPVPVVSNTKRSSIHHHGKPVVAPNITGQGEATTQAVNPTVHIVYPVDNKFPLGKPIKLISSLLQSITFSLNYNVFAHVSFVYLTNLFRLIAYML